MITKWTFSSYYRFLLLTFHIFCLSKFDTRFKSKEDFKSFWTNPHFLAGTIEGLQKNSEVHLQYKYKCATQDKATDMMVQGGILFLKYIVVTYFWQSVRIDSACMKARVNL